MLTSFSGGGKSKGADGTMHRQRETLESNIALSMRQTMTSAQPVVVVASE
jgi:hypothetical protein